MPEAKFDFDAPCGLMVTRKINTCTKVRPWKEGDPTPVQHTDAREVGEQRDGSPGGDIITMKCPNCGAEWEQELAQ